MKRLILLLLASCALVLVGCNEYGLVDDIDLDFDLVQTTSDELHMPYVEGSAFDLSVWTRTKNHDRSTFHLESDSPSILRIGSQSDGSAKCHAVSAGTAEVRVYEGEPRSLVYTTEIEIKTPTRAELTPAGPLIVNPDSAPPIGSNTVQVLQNGTITFLVTYFAGDEPLYGVGALTAEGDSDTDTLVLDSFLFEDREWLQATPSTLGAHTVQLGTVAGASLGSVALDTVDASAVTHVEIAQSDERSADSGAWLAVLGQAYDAHDRPVYGVSYDWKVGGVSQFGEGDLYRYQFDPSEPKSVTAHFNGFEASSIIHSDHGYVDSSNDVGCAATPSAPSGSFVFLAGLLMLVAAARARRTC